MTLVFVYGTLKRGQRNHRLLAASRFVGAATTRPLYRLHACGPYPCLVPAGADGRAIRGEVYEVDDTMLAQLDWLEGAPDLYRRGPVELADGAGPAVAYFYQGDVSAFPDCGTCWP